MNSKQVDIPNEVFVVVGAAGPTLEGVYWSRENAESAMDHPRCTSGGPIQVVMYVRGETAPATVKQSFAVELAVATGTKTGTENAGGNS